MTFLAFQNCPNLSSLDYYCIDLVMTVVCVEKIHRAILNGSYWSWHFSDNHQLHLC